MTSASATILSEIQRDAFAWAKRNFGATLTPETQLLGLCEEHSEACEAMAHTEDYVDAVGDSGIFLFQFCSLLQWDIGELWDTRTHGLDMPSRPWPILIGKICHAYVKGRVQRYRGTTAEHDANCRAAIQTLLRHWDHHTQSIGHDFVAVVEQTWRKVAARDWTVERPAPGEMEDSPLSRVFGKLPESPAIECGDQLMNTSRGLQRWSVSDQQALAEFTKEQHAELVAFVERRIASRQTAEAIDESAEAKS
jgi:hypothetical protein